MSYVGWPTKVNRSVLDSTQATVGEGATKEESLETGKKRSKMTVSNAPKKFNVTMRFNYVDKDAQSPERALATEIKINEGGGVEFQPKGFFDQAEKDLGYLMGF